MILKVYLDNNCYFKYLKIGLVKETIEVKYTYNEKYLLHIPTIIQFHRWTDYQSANRSETLWDLRLELDLLLLINFKSRF